MTNTYRTGNPLGSTSPKDLFDNASNFDEAINSSSPRFSDRFGKQRETWTGLEQKFLDFLAGSGYQFIGAYESGPLTVSLPNQIFSRAGEYWRASPSLALPYTTVNNWTVDASKFVSVGDASLRQALANYTDPAQGANLVGYRNRSVYERLDDTINVKDFGAQGDGVSDDYAAVMAAFNALNAAGGGSLKFPAGTYYFGHSLDFLGQYEKALHLVGDGNDATVLLFAAGAQGVRITRPIYEIWYVPGSTQVRDMTIATAGGSDATVGLYIDGAEVTGRPSPLMCVQNVTFRGNSLSAYWGVNLKYYRVTNSNTHDCYFFGRQATPYVGQGIVWEGTTDMITTQHVVTGCQATFLLRCLSVGEYVQGLFVDYCNFVSVASGIVWVVVGDQTELHVSNCQMYCQSVALNIENIGYMFIHDNLFILGSATTPGIGIQANSVILSKIHHNTFYGGVVPAGAFGVVLGNSLGKDQASYPNLVESNMFTALGTGIWVQPGANGNYIGTNIYTVSCAVGLLDNGASRVTKRSWTLTTTLAVAAGATATATIAVPTGIFRDKPTVAQIFQLDPGAEMLLGWYQSNLSSATSLSFKLAPAVAATIPAGNYAFTVRAEE